MARSRGRSRPPSRRPVPQRLPPVLPRLALARSPQHVPLTPPLALPEAPLSPERDRRTFHPSHPFQPAPSARPADRRLVINPTNVARLAFAEPRGVLVCVRRSIRKQVLFAAGVGGRKGRKRRPRRTPHSSIGC